MKKKYFVTSQRKNTVIVELVSVPKGYEDKYIELTEEQLKFLEENPAANPDEVQQCKKYTKETTVIEESLEQYKERQIIEISDLSLRTSKKKINDYQFLNAQASLLTDEDKSIYSHDKANEIIAEYNTVGKLCRDKYYGFVEDLNSCTTMQAAKACVENIIQWYRNI